MAKTNLNKLVQNINVFYFIRSVLFFFSLFVYNNWRLLAQASDVCLTLFSNPYFTFIIIRKKYVAQNCLLCKMRLPQDDPFITYSSAVMQPLQRKCKRPNEVNSFQPGGANEPFMKYQETASALDIVK